MSFNGYPYGNNIYGTTGGYGNTYFPSSQPSVYQNIMPNQYSNNIGTTQSNMNIRNTTIPQTQPQTTQPQQVFHPLTFVNGKEGAKSFIVNPGQLVYMLDSEDESALYMKSTDAIGRSTINTFKIFPVNENNNNANNAPSSPTTNYVSKEDLDNMKNEINKNINSYFDKFNSKIDAIINTKKQVNYNSKKDNELTTNKGGE